MEWGLLEGDGPRAAVVAADDADAGVNGVFDGLEEGGDVFGGVDVVAAELVEDIAGFDAALGGGGVGLDGVDVDALGGGEGLSLDRGWG